MELERDHKHREIVFLIARVMRKLALVYLPIYAFLMVAGREFILTLFTPRYADSWPLFAANLTMVPFAMFLTDPVVRAYAQQRHFILKLHLVLFLLLTAALPFATRYFGMLGAIYVIVGINILSKIVLAGKLGRMVGLERGDFKLLRGVGMVALAAATAALVTALLRVSLPPWKPLAVLMVCGICYTIVYLASVWIMKIPAPDERALLDRFLGRMGIQTST
jgi:O-antigen/teichoic acid export membrane protein